MPLYTPSTESQTETQEMQVLYFSNEFPRDDIQSLFRRLRTISKDRSHEILARFIDEATCTVRDEVRQLPASTKSAFPSFNTVFDLADYQDLRNGPLEGSVNGVLLCVLELATLIWYVGAIGSVSDASPLISELINTLATVITKRPSRTSTLIHPLPASPVWGSAYWLLPLCLSPLHSLTCLLRGRRWFGLPSVLVFWYMMSLRIWNHGTTQKALSLGHLWSLELTQMKSRLS